MNEGGADETFVRGEKLKLAVHEGEELFFEGRLSQTRILADGSNRLIHTGSALLPNGGLQ